MATLQTSTQLLTVLLFPSLMISGTCVSAVSNDEYTRLRVNGRQSVLPTYDTYGTPGALNCTVRGNC